MEAYLLSEDGKHIFASQEPVVAGKIAGDGNDGEEGPRHRSRGKRKQTLFPRKVEENSEDESSIDKKLKQSPKKRPRNIRINVCDILKNKTVIIEEHQPGCEPSKITVGTNPELVWNLERRKKKKVHNKEETSRTWAMAMALAEHQAVALKEVPKPILNSQSSYSMVKGYKIIDTNQMGLALTLAQKCNHGTLILVENIAPGSQVDLATQLGFVCTTCGAQTMFITSKFNFEKPSNYSINKQLMGKLGKAAYDKLVEEVTMQESQRAAIKFKRTQGALPKPKMILGYASSSIKQTKEPKTFFEGVMKKKIFSTQSKKSNLNAHIEVEADPLELTEGNEPSDSQDSADNAFDPCQYDPASPPLTSEDKLDQESKLDPGELLCSEIKEEPAGVAWPECVIESEPEKPGTGVSCDDQDHLSNGSIDDLLKDDPDPPPAPKEQADEQEAPKTKHVLKIRSFKDLQQEKIDVESPQTSEGHSWTIAEGSPPEDPPPLAVSSGTSLTCSDIAPNTQIRGGTVTPVRAGVKIVSSNVIRSTITKSGLPRGVYRFRPQQGNEAILVVSLDKTPEVSKQVVKAEEVPPERGMTPMDLYINKMTANEQYKELRRTKSNGKVYEMYKRKWFKLSEEVKQLYREEAAKLNSVKVLEPKGISLSGESNEKETDNYSNYSGLPLPKGWRINTHRIKGYKTVNVSSPNGRVFTEKEELNKFVEDNCIDIDTDLIDFAPHVLYLPGFPMPIVVGNKKTLFVKQIKQMFVNLNLETHEGFPLPLGVWVPLSLHKSKTRAKIPLGYRSDVYNPPNFNQYALNYKEMRQRFLLDPEGKKQNMMVKMIVNAKGEKIFQIPFGYKLLGEAANDFILEGVRDQHIQVLVEEGIHGPWSKSKPSSNSAPSAPVPVPSAPTAQLPVLDNAKLFDDYDERVLKNDGNI